MGYRSIDTLDLIARAEELRAKRGHRLSGRCLRSLAQQLAAMLASEESEESEVVMTELGYADLWKDGEVFFDDEVVAKLDPDSVHTHCPVCRYANEDTERHKDCDDKFIGGELEEDEAEELEAIEDLEKQGIEDFCHGAHLIHCDDFEEYAEELADDLGLISKDAKWPYTCIDWEQAARELSQDYSRVTYLGDDYYVR